MEKKTNTIMLGILYSLPIIYKGNMKMIDKIITNITNDKNMDIYSNSNKSYL